MDQRLEKLMKQLGDAINESLADSEQIAKVISKIKAGGYDVFLVLEATIGFNRRDDEDETDATETTSRANLQISPQDVKFLKSLRISVDQEVSDSDDFRDRAA